MLRWGVLAMALFVVSACAGGGSLDEYQVDPLTVTPPDSPNWALAASPETETAATPSRDAPVFGTGPEELLDYLDQVVANAPRTEALVPAFDAETPSRAYVQRSATVGFPDVISAVAIDLGAGDAGQRSAIALYSRSVYGYSDLGVNAERLDRWLERLAEVAPVVSGRGAE